jgi:hypothetical protein
MSLGRYEPPRAFVETTGEIDARTPSDRPKRPFAVTAFEVLLVLISVLSLLKSVRLGVWIVTNGDARYLSDAALRLAWAVVWIVPPAGAVVAIHKARPYARYFGWLIFAVLIGFAHIDAPANYATTPAMRGGYEAADGLWEILLLIWALRFGLSAKAKRYFGEQTAISR